MVYITQRHDRVALLGKEHPAEDGNTERPAHLGWISGFQRSTIRLARLPPSSESPQ